MMERELKRTQRDAEVFAEKGGGIEKFRMFRDRT
jgi:hypothetical protein